MCPFAAKSAQQGQETQALRKLLEFYCLPYLEKDLSRIKDIEKLATGVFGGFLLSSIAERHFYKRKEEASLLATKAFNVFAQIREDFRTALENNGKEGDAFFRRPLWERVADAFAQAMAKNVIRYEVTADAAAGIVNRRIDCDIASILLIQLGKESGLDMIGHYIPPDESGFGHFQAVVRENGLPSKHIDASALLYKKKDQEWLGKMRLGLKSAKAEPGLDYKKIRELESKMTEAEAQIRICDVQAALYDAAQMTLENPLASYLDDEAALSQKRYTTLKKMAEAAREMVESYRRIQKAILFTDPLLKKEYSEVKRILRETWELSGNFELFRCYFEFLEIASGSKRPTIKKEAERARDELFKEGEDRFGRDALERHQMRLPEF